MENQSFKRLYIDIPPYYKLEIAEEGIKVYSFSKYRGGVKKELSQYKDPSGYLRVKLNNKHFHIHYLVAKYCIGERPNGLCINHIDGNKYNNFPTNLEYITRAENTSKMVEQGLHVSNRPHTHGNYIDGRCSNIVEYKKAWYLRNRDRMLEKNKKNYYTKKYKNV